MSNSGVEHKRPEKEDADAEDALNDTSHEGNRISQEEHQSSTNSESQQKKKGSYPPL